MPNVVICRLVKIEPNVAVVVLRLVEIKHNVGHV
jgi:hypothetical protein